MTNQGSSDADLFACCSFRHGLCRATFRQRELLFSYAPAKLVSPFGRDVAQRQSGLGSLGRELDCRKAARLREQPVSSDELGKL